MSAELTNFVTVFRTGQLVHLDWATNALKEAGIPLQQREETSGGLRVAMPVAPSSGPGQWWSIVVPESLVGQSLEVLASLPFEATTRPDVWSFQPKRGVKTGWQVYSWIMLGIMVLTGILWCVDFARRWK